MCKDMDTSRNIKMSLVTIWLLLTIAFDRGLLFNPKEFAWHLLLIKRENGI